MLLVSTGFKKAILGPSAFADIFAGGQIRLFAGTRPATADSAEPATPLAVIERAGANKGLQFYLFDQYVINKPGDKWRLRGLGSGTVVWWRLVGAADDGQASFSQPRIDGDIGSTTAPQEMVLASAVMTPTTLINYDSFMYTLPPLNY